MSTELVEELKTGIKENYDLLKSKILFDKYPFVDFREINDINFLSDNCIVVNYVTNKLVIDENMIIPGFEKKSVILTLDYFKNPQMWIEKTIEELKNIKDMENLWKLNTVINEHKTLLENLTSFISKL